MEHTLEMIESARKHDVDIAFDIIPPLIAMESEAKAISPR